MGVTAVQPERKDVEKVIAVLKDALSEALASKQVQNVEESLEPSVTA